MLADEWAAKVLVSFLYRDELDATFIISIINRVYAPPIHCIIALSG